jgi:hypothetical protein
VSAESEGSGNGPRGSLTREFGHAAQGTLRRARCTGTRAGHAAQSTLRRARCAGHAVAGTLWRARCAEHAAQGTLRRARGPATSQEERRAQESPEKGIDPRGVLVAL